MEQLKQMSITELKAIAYDCLAQMEGLQRTLKAVNEELEGKDKAIKEFKPEEKVAKEK